MKPAFNPTLVLGLVLVLVILLVFVLAQVQVPPGVGPGQAFQISVPAPVVSVPPSGRRAVTTEDGVSAQQPIVP